MFVHMYRRTDHSFGTYIAQIAQRPAQFECDLAIYVAGSSGSAVAVTRVQSIMRRLVALYHTTIKNKKYVAYTALVCCCSTTVVRLESCCVLKKSLAERIHAHQSSHL